LTAIGASTLDTYSHAIPAMQEEEAERIAGLAFDMRRPMRARRHAAGS